MEVIAAYNTKTPSVSIITVNYNQLQVTCELLDSLRESDYPNYEVIVVDNNSEVNPYEHLSIYYPEAIVINSDTNDGFAGGNNLGIQSSQGDLLFFINNDAIVLPNTISMLVNIFINDKNVGAVSPKICYYPENPNTQKIIQYIGATKVNVVTGRNKILGEKEIDKNQYCHKMLTPYTHGAAMMVSRNVIAKVGMFPEEYFLYYEELDWCSQMNKAGFTLVVEPNATVFHKESLSTGTDSPFKTYFINRSRILFMRRNSTFIEFSAFILFLVFFTIPKNTITFFLKGKKGQLKAFFDAISWNFLGKKELPLYVSSRINRFSKQQNL
ncbi:MAG: glycosyltransferase family 2 protein [Saprospiraceae bacterium]|nr:glycosyltransferase family 2 protein [Saprospiraceae bacterium]